jgi:hypothetical protein
MWIVKVALNRPYTFIVLALLILILSSVAILQTPTDIFPTVNIPVVAVAWIYTGMNPEELEGRVTTVYEKVLTTTVDNIQHTNPLPLMEPLSSSYFCSQGRVSTAPTPKSLLYRRPYYANCRLAPCRR